MFPPRASPVILLEFHIADKVRGAVTALRATFLLCVLLLSTEDSEVLKETVGGWCVSGFKHSPPLSRTKEMDYLEFDRPGIGLLCGLKLPISALKAALDVDEEGRV